MIRQGPARVCVCDGAGGVAREQGQCCPVHSDLSGEPGELVVVEHDRCRWCVASDRHSRGCVQPLVDAVQERFDAGWVTGRHAGTDERDGENRSRVEELFGERLEPPAKGRVLAGLADRRRRQFDQLCGSLEVLAGEGLLDRRDGSPCWSYQMLARR